jgi:uncharacterized protein (TIGR00369 family)
MTYNIVDGVLGQLKAGEVRDPISSLMGMRLVDFGRGEAVFELPLRPEVGNAMGVVQGGVAAVIADVATAMAMTSTLDDEQFPVSAITTVDLFARLIRPVSVNSGVLRAEAKVVRTGKQIVWSECETMAGGKLTGKFSATGMRVVFKAQDLQRSASSADLASIPPDAITTPSG